MAEGALYVTVRFLHILFGVAWVGGALLYGHSVVGGLRSAPPQVRGPAMLRIVEKMLTFFLTAGPLTILFGVWNQWIIMGELRYEGGTWNVLLGGALLLALAMFGLGLGLQRPTFLKLRALAAAHPNGPPPDLVAPLQKRQMIGGLAITAMGVVALLLMVAATATRAG